MRQLAPATTSHARRTTWSVGIGLVALGTLGLVPGVTTNYNDMTWTGPHSGALLFGLVGVTVLYNLIHIALGALGLLASHTTRRSLHFLIGGGALYLLMSGYGAITRDHVANIVAFDSAHTIGHAAIGAALLTLGIALRQPSLDRY